MRAQVKWLLTAVLAGLTASPLLGQAPRGGALLDLLENGMDKPMLLAIPGVKKEIKLTDKQDAQVKKIVQEVHAKYRPDFQKAGGDPQKLAKVGMASAQEVRERMHKELPDILKPEQLKRLDQIQIQANGILSFKRADVQKKLNLTDKQKQGIRQIGDQLKKDVADVLQDVRTAPLRKGPAAMGKIKDLKNAATRKALDTLDSEQQQTWKEMTGDKFELHVELPGRPIRRR
jgi:Spy/CpxP family protein refolding chaperone